eukprot:g18247.t1
MVGVMDTAKAMVPDNILAIVLKTSAPELAAPLAKLFQYSHNTGIYLIMQKIAWAMECVIHSAIKQPLLSDAQFELCHGHSASDLIAALFQTWTREPNSRGE